MVMVPNPGTVFAGIGMLGGVGREDAVPAYHDPKFRGFRTDRVNHVGDGTWRFNDPSIGRDVQFRQNRDGDFLIQGPDGGWNPQAQHDGFGWNLTMDGARLRQGGGADSEFSDRAFGPPDGLKRLPWQYAALQSGPRYNPVTPESLARAEEQRQQQLNRTPTYTETEKRVMANNPWGMNVFQRMGRDLMKGQG